jgi:hypothetical protein
VGIVYVGEVVWVRFVAVIFEYVAVGLVSCFLEERKGKGATDRFYREIDL